MEPWLIFAGLFIASGAVNVILARALKHQRTQTQIQRALAKAAERALATCRWLLRDSKKSDTQKVTELARSLDVSVGPLGNYGSGSNGKI